VKRRMLLLRSFGAGGRESPSALGGFQALYPAPDPQRQADYEGLLRAAAAVFQRNSVWSKAQSSLQRLQAWMASRVSVALPVWEGCILRSMAGTKQQPKPRVHCVSHYHHDHLECVQES